MKKTIALLMSVLLLFTLVSCSSSKGNSEDSNEQYEIMANFSKIDKKGNIVVAVQNLGGVYEELYDKNGLVLKFINGEDEIYDSDGKKINSSELECGDSLVINYDGKLAKNNPKTIRVYKISKL